MESRIKELIKLRKGFLMPDVAEEVQKELINIYRDSYKPQHTAEEYLNLILEDNVCEIKERHYQSSNYVETVYEVFSVVSQHVQGITKEHCLDQIWDVVERRKERIKYYKTLPELRDLVDCDLEIIPEQMYDTREKDQKNSCSSYSGETILRMRKIGIGGVMYEDNKDFWDKCFPTIESLDNCTQ